MPLPTFNSDMETQILSTLMLTADLILSWAILVIIALFLVFDSTDKWIRQTLIGLVIFLSVTALTMLQTKTQQYTNTINKEKLMTSNTTDYEEIIKNPATSDWLISALKSALERDPVDACADAEQLFFILSKRVNNHFHEHLF